MAHILSYEEWEIEFEEKIFYMSEEERREAYEWYCIEHGMEALLHPDEDDDYYMDNDLTCN